MLFSEIYQGELPTGVKHRPPPFRWFHTNDPTISERGALPFTPHVFKDNLRLTTLVCDVVTGPVARFARQIAGHGYVVAAPSSYHEFVGPEPLAYDVPGTDKGNELKITKVRPPLFPFQLDATKLRLPKLRFPAC